jgi:hypothetical protein
VNCGFSVQEFGGNAGPEEGRIVARDHRLQACGFCGEFPLEPVAMSMHTGSLDFVQRRLVAQDDKEKERIAMPRFASERTQPGTSRSGGEIRQGEKSITSCSGRRPD